MSLPRNKIELLRMISLRNPHPAQKMAYNAFTTNRCPSQAFILLLGVSGSGKSSTINYLFGKDLAKVTNFTSGQCATEEYYVTMTSEEWKIKDLRLSFIDTPGFCDVRGLEQDAKNIATILHFKKNHEFLQNSFPNLVFLVIDSTDTRIEGDRSRLAKLMHGIKDLKVIDKKRPNLIIVLTHIAALARKKSAWLQKVAEVKEKIQSLVSGHLGIRPIIVVQENKPDDFELEENGEWHVLPNGQKQPRELYMACKKMLNSSCDEIGHEAIALCFRPGDTKPETGFNVTTTDIEDSEVAKLYSSLRDYEIKEPDTPICKLLEKYKIENYSKDVDNAVVVLKYRLTDLNIKKPNEIQCMTFNKLKAIVYPVEISVDMEEIIKKLFGLKYEESAGIVCPIGKGFNIFHDVETQECPVVLTKNHGQMGYPGNTTFSNCSKLKVICESVLNHNEYIQHRLGELDFKGDIAAHLGLCEMKVKGGYNLEEKNKDLSIQSFKQVSFLIEHTLIQVDLNNPYIPSEQFKQDVHVLPLKYEENDEDNLLKWKAFIEKWGNHFIVGVMLGGSIQGKALTNRSKNLKESDLCNHVMGEISMKYNVLQSGATTNIDRQALCSSMEDVAVVISTSSLEWNGGDMSKCQLSLNYLVSDDLIEWEKSLRYNPAPLSSSLKLCPIYELVKLIDEEKGHEMQKASKIQSDLKVFEQNTRETVGASNKSSACFPSTASVTLVDGRKKNLKDIHIGEKVFSVDRSGNRTVDQIISWIHKVANIECKFLRIIHQFGTLEISQEHIFFVGKDRLPCHAINVKLGDTLHFYQQNETGGVFVQSIIYSIDEVDGHGLYAPLTLNGNILVDGIFVSCYCLVKSIHVGNRQIVSCHSLCHFAFLPLRVAYRIKIEINKMKNSKETGIHKYAEWLMKIAMATGMISGKPEQRNEPWI